MVRTLLRHQAPTWNRTILDRWVRRAFESADETRTVVTHSGVAPNPTEIDGSASHLFFGWSHGAAADLGGFAAAVPRMVQFVSEFGAQSVPDEAGFMEPQRWPDLRWDHLAERHGMDLAAFAEHVPPSDHVSFEQWKHSSQQYQAEVLRHHIETLRRLKYRPAGGFCFLGLNDARPSVGWGVLDHERNPKAAWAAVVEACRPVIVVADRVAHELTAGDAAALDVHVVSDVHRLIEQVVCSATLRWPGGQQQWQWSGDIPPDTCVRVGTMQFVVPDVRGELWIDLVLEHGDVVVTNRYTTTVLARR
jgi:beta-mannosidase